MADDKLGKKAIKAGLGYTIGNVFCRGFSFVSAFIFARLMSKADYGIYNIFASYVSILSVVIGFALHASIRNAKLDYGKNLEPFCSSVSLIVLGNTAVLLAMAVVFQQQLGNILSIPAILVALVVLESFATAVMQYYNEYLAVNFQSKKYLIISLFYALAGTSLSVLLICTVCSQQRYLGRALGTAIPLLLIAVYILAFFFRKSRPRINREYWKYGLKISLPIVPHGLSQIILSQFDRIMIKKAVSDEAAGLYSFANNIGYIFQVVTNSLNTAWSPWFFEQMRDKAYPKIRKSASAYVALVSVMAVGVLLVSPELIMLMGGREYYESRIVVLPIVLSVYFGFLYMLPSGVEYYYKKTKYIAIGTMCAAVLNIALNGYFVPRYGYVAAAYTTVFCYLCYFLIHLFLSRQIHGSMIFDLQVLFGCALAVTAATFLCVWLVDQTAIRLGIVAVALVIAGVLAFRNRQKIKSLLHGLRNG